MVFNVLEVFVVNILIYHMQNSSINKKIIGLRGESVENIDLDFLADLASLGSKLMRKEKKWPSPYVKWFPRGA